jgi:hypothetical protein
MSDSRLKRSHRALGLGQPFRDLDFERCYDCVSRPSDAGKDVARHQPQSDPVRVVKNEGVVGLEVKRGGCRYRRSGCAPAL